ncbi:hypothetical protein PRIC2_010886 [Phytophthora ramorum]|uniref:Elicitin n=1 Tax=Phytophthora ramorum TaxID=164328 RepID=Q2N0B6_PHYRM|nr:elicitin-like protein RAL3 [Phytophthora ramorum]
MPSLTSFVLIGLAVAGSVNAEDCSTESLMSLASNSNLANCTSETGISVATISTLSHDDIMSVCESSACMALMSDVASLGLGDCTIPGSNVSIQSDVLDSVTSMCGGSGSMGSMDMVGSSSSTGTTGVGDSSASSDKVVGGSSSSSKSGAATVTIGCVSTMAMAAVAMLL